MSAMVEVCRSREKATGQPRVPDHGNSSVPVAELGVVALSVGITLSAFHALFPAVAGYAERSTNEQAGFLVVLVFAVPLFTPLVRRLGGRRAPLVAVLALAGWRAAVLVGRTIPLPVAVVGGLIGLLAVTLVLTSERFTAAGALGVLGGLVLDVVSRTSFATWDPVWQRTAPAVVVGLVTSAALVAVVIWCHRSSVPDRATPVGVRGAGPGLAFGALLALEVLFLSSPSYIASSAGVGLTLSVAVVLVGLAGACAVVTELPVGGGRVVAAAVALMAIGALLPVADGVAAVFVLVIAGQVAIAVVLTRALDPRAGISGFRGEVGFAAGWLVFAVSILLYQLHFDQPLPFDNRWIVAGVGGMTALGALGRGSVRAPGAGGSSLRNAAAWTAGFALIGAVLVPIGLATTNTTSSAFPAPRTLRVVEWNVRQTVTDDGQLDPEGFARTLERAGPPDVVILVEAARGWPMSGDLDLASWLSRRLGLAFVWGGAADNQFGNLVLSRLPIVTSRVIPLPVAGDAQGRSLVRAELDLGDGARLTVLATHLQHRNDARSMAARMAEIDAIVHEWGGAPQTVLAGDLNPRQGDPPGYPPRVPGDFEEIRALLTAGFTTTQDLHSCQLPTSNRNCSDYVFVTSDLQESSFDVLPSSLSDHRPIVTTVNVS